jgi:hypothetical protein
MSGIGWNPWIAAALLTALALSAVSLGSTLLTSGFAALLGLVGVALFRGNRWRTGALLLSAVAVSLVFLDAMAGWLAPKPMGQGVVYVPEFFSWAPPDPVLGYRLRPNNTVAATATLGQQTVYRATYTINTEGWRATPRAPAGADTYLFMGDSCVFGQGLDDDQTLAAQFAKANGFRVRTVNLAVPGYGPNHLVRAFEAGLFDRYLDQPVKAVVTWIKPPDLARVTGDEPWLKSSPRYVLENGSLRYTGSFDEHRQRSPVDGLVYLAGKQFAFVKAIRMRQRQELQADLFLALIGRLQVLARERFSAPLVVVYQWPDEAAPAEDRNPDYHQAMLKAIFDRLRRIGTPLVSVGELMEGTEVSHQIILHDGHPTALTNQRIATELKRRLNGP